MFQSSTPKHKAAVAKSHPGGKKTAQLKAMAGIANGKAMKAKPKAPQMGNKTQAKAQAGRAPYVVGKMKMIKQHRPSQLK